MVKARRRSSAGSFVGAVSMKLSLKVLAKDCGVIVMTCPWTVP